MNANPILPLSEADIGAIQTLTDAISQQALAGDWDALLDLFAEDVILMPPNSEVIRGHDGFQAMLEGINPDFSEHFIKLHEIDGYGDLAYAWGTYTETYTVSQAPDPIADIAKLMFIYRKQADGTWRVAVEMWNTDLP